MLFLYKGKKIHRTLRLFGAVLSIALLAGLFSPATAKAGENDLFHWPAGPQLTSEGAVLIEAETGAVLFEKNGTKQFYPASTTKLMTALLALENSALGETVTISRNAVYDIDVDSSRIWVDVGEELSMEDSLYALMLPSANDLAYAIAEHIGGTKADFADMMNARAEALGCENTHFMNPHGLDEDNHYSCPLDLARIMRPLVKNSTFIKISGSKNHKIPKTNLCDEDRWILNTHLMLRGTYTYDGVIAGKTGHTDLAGANLVTCAKRGNMTLIAVIMKAPDDTALYDDTATLLNYGFDNFATYSVTDEQVSLNNDVPPLFNGEDTIQLVGEDIITSDSGIVVLPSSASLSDITKNVQLTQLTSFAEGKNLIGKITYSYGTRTVGTSNIIYNNKGPAFTLSSGESAESSGTDEGTPSSTPKAGQEKTENTPKKERLPLIIGIILGCICFLIGVYFVFVELPYRRKRSAYLKKKNKRF